MLMNDAAIVLKRLCCTKGRFYSGGNVLNTSLLRLDVEQTDLAGVQNPFLWLPKARSQARRGCTSR